MMWTVDPKNDDIEVKDAFKAMENERYAQINETNELIETDEEYHTKINNTMSITNYFGNISKDEAGKKAFEVCKRPLKTSLIIGAKKITKKGKALKKAIKKTIQVFSKGNLTTKNFFTMGVTSTKKPSITTPTAPAVETSLETSMHISNFFPTLSAFLPSFLPTSFKASMTAPMPGNQASITTPNSSKEIGTTTPYSNDDTTVVEWFIIR